VTSRRRSSTHTCAGIHRAADWLADAGYELADTEPPQIAEAAAALFDAIWADIGAPWPGMEPSADPMKSSSSMRA
jgi:hypothetical protein